jgi:hypothetical protein
MNPSSIVVIDDGSRFPLHVWRYVSRCLGFGIGDVAADGRQAVDVRDGKVSGGKVWIEQGSGTCLAAFDGTLRLWWVGADDSWGSMLGEIFKWPETRVGRVLALVDIHGRAGSKYRAEDACDYLQDRSQATDVTWWPVSAYHSVSRMRVKGKREALPVLPKSRETLRKVVATLRIEPPRACPCDGVRHILISGAGFEIRDQRGGFGLPSTRELLQGMGEPFWYDDGTPDGAPPARGDRGGDRLILGPAGGEDAAGEAFPVARSGRWEPGTEERRDLDEFAKKRALDSYWDVLLEVEVRKTLGPTRWPTTAIEREEKKARASRHERRLRQAFRHSLLQHDWGYMNQSLDAARLPLHAWLTTNYTQFANRAISLYGGDPEQARLGEWRIVATAAEARTLDREGPYLDPAPSFQPSAGGGAAARTRYLFKLHGDIAHLQTMAIAGHDKDVFSPLSMPIEDLYEVYAAAERYLLHSLDRADRAPVVWHVVGHGLQDRRLCSLLRRVAQHLQPDRQLFAVINPWPNEPVEELKKALGEGPYAIAPLAIDAGDYLARLRRLLGGGDQAQVPTSVERLREWLSGTRHDFEQIAPSAGLY